MANKAKKKQEKVPELPENKFGIKVVDEESESVYETFGISKKRWEELTSKAEPLVERLLNDDRSGKRRLNTCDMIMELAALCDTTTELSILIAGTMESLGRYMSNPLSQLLNHIVNH